MDKKLEAWVILQKFLDLRSGIILSFLVFNTVGLSWYCVRRHLAFPDGYVTALGVIFTGATIGKTAKIMKGTDNE